MIEPFAPRNDWYKISADQARALGHSPGVVLDQRSNVWIAHRNQLPLLDVDLAPTASAVVPVFGDGVTQLRPHQVEGLKFMSDRSGILQADAMRVGKTSQIVAFHDPDAGPLVIVAPLATKRVWVDWCARRWPDEPVIILTGREFEPDRVDQARIIFIHYDVVAYWVSIGIRRRIGTLVLDEGHKLANRKSRRAQNVTVMAPAAERVVLATGTPLWNKPAGLYPLLNVISPGAWGTFSNFTERYCGGHPGSHGWQTGDATNVEEFKQRMSEVMIRRVWAQLVDDLVPTTRKLERVTFTGDKLDQLEKIAAVLSDDVDYRTLIGELARYRRLVGHEKGRAAAALALKNPGPGVVWIWHKNVAQIVEDGVREGGRRVWQITGKVVEHHREAVLDEWRAVPDGILVMSMPIGQAGIDLSHAADCIFAELDWTPAVIGQAEMRTFSPFRGDCVTYVVADHDVDLRLASTLAAKCEQSKLLGMPAADTAIDIVAQMFRGETPTEADFASLASRMIARVRADGTTFE